MVFQLLFSIPCKIEVINELKLFPDIHHNTYFSINVFEGHPKTIKFICIFNLFSSKTIKVCKNHNNHNDPIPGIKSEDGKWEVRGHINRIVKITEKELELSATLFEDSVSLAQKTRLLQFHSKEIIEILKSVVSYKNSLSDYKNRIFVSQMLNESNAQKFGLIERQSSPSFHPQKVNDWIISGSQMNVGTPANKCAYTVCSHNNAYDDIDLTSIDDSYFPKSVYRPCNSEKSAKYNDFVTSLKFEINDKKRSVIDKYRYVNRLLAKPTDSRTLISTIIPPGAAHINSLSSITFDDERLMVVFTGSTHSICYDFIIKLAGKNNVHFDLVSTLPVLSGKFVDPIIWRTLRLNCVTLAYSELWKKVVDSSIKSEFWTTDDVALVSVHPR